MQRKYIAVLLGIFSFLQIFANCDGITETLKRPFRTAENNQAFPIRTASLFDANNCLSSLCCIECLTKKIDKKADIIIKDVDLLRIELNYVAEDIINTINECCNDIRVELNYIFEDLTKIIIELSSQLEQCCEFLTSAIEVPSSLISVIETTTTSLIDQSTETIVSSIEECCDFLFSAIESSTGMINSSIDVGIGSLIDESANNIISTVEQCCGFLTSVIDISTTSIIEITTASLIDQSTENIISAIEGCCDRLNSVIDNTTNTVSIIDTTITSLIDTTVTSLIDQSTETIVSSIEECCDLLFSGIEAIDEKLDTLTGSTLDDVVTRIEILISGLDIIISQAEGLIPVFSILEDLAEDILINISIIDFAFNKTISAVEECCMSITDTVNSSTDFLSSQIDACCDFLTSVIDNTTNTISVIDTTITSLIDTTITSLIDQSTATLSSRIETCCNTLSEQIENSTEITTELIDESTNIIVGAVGDVSSQLEECCDLLASGIEQLDEKLDALTGSTLDDVVTRLEILISGLDIIISQAEGLIPVFSILEDLAEDILINISSIDVVFNKTISAVEECCMSITDTVNSSTDFLSSQIDACCDFLTSVIESSTASAIDITVTSIVDQSTSTLSSRIEACCESISDKIDTCCETLSDQIDNSTNTTATNIANATTTILGGVAAATTVITTAITNATNSINNNIDNSTDEIIETIQDSTELTLSQLDACCDLLSSGIEELDEKLDALTGSTLDDVVTRLEILISGLDIIISQAEGLIPVFSTLEELAEDILLNISVIDFAFNKTVSAVEECCMSLTDRIEESTDSIFSKIDECCDFLTSVIETNTASAIDITVTSIVDQSTSTLSSKIDACCETLSDKIDTCCETLSDKIDTCCSTLSEQIENSTEIVTDVIDESTNIIVGAVGAVSSQLEECCDLLASGIDQLDEKLDALTGSTLDDVVTRLEILISGLDIIISQAEGLVPVFSTLDELAEDILTNISAIDVVFNQTISAVDACCQTLSDKIDTCCETLSDQIDNSTSTTATNIANATTTILGGIANATTVITTAITNATNSINNNIDNSTDEIIDVIAGAAGLTSSQLEQCCDMLSSGIEELDEKLDALTGSTLDDVVTRLEILISGLDIIISQADNLVPVFSTLDELAEDILTNISAIDVVFNRTVSAVEECCSSIMDFIDESAAFTCSCVDANIDDLVSLIENIDIQLGDRTVINEFDTPLTITSSGSFILSSDFNNPSPTDFTLSISGVSDVILDLNNFIIDGGNVSLGGILIDGATNVVVQNGSIINSGGPAIQITNSMNVVIENVMVNGTATPGGATIIIDNSTQTILQDVLAFNESGGPVVEITNSSNTTVQDTTGKSSTGGGFPSGIFSVASSLATRFINTIACSPFGVPSTAIGFGISGSTGVGFFNSSAINCDVGFQIEDSIDVIFDHSIAQGNAGNGVMFLGGGSDTFVVCFATAIGNGDNGFYINGLNTIFKNTVATDNGGAGFYIDASASKVLFEIAIGTDNDIGLFVDASATIVNIYDSYFKGNNTDIINPSNALFVNIDTTLEILCSKIEHCCTNLTSDIDDCCGMLSSGIEAIDEKLDALTGSTLDDVVTRLEILISGLDIIISSSEGLISVFSTLEVLSEEILSNISIIDFAFDKTVSAVEECCMSINEAIDQSTNIIVGAIDQSTDVIISSIDSNIDCLIGTPITSVPFIITTPGLYTLCEDLTQTGVTPAITIASDDVTLNLGQYTLTTTGGSRGIEILPGMTNITIRNGNIVPDREAIFVNLNEDVLIEDISIYNAGMTAIRVESSVGVIINQCAAIGSNGSLGAPVPAAFWFGITDITGDGRLGAVVTNCTVRSDSLNGFFIRGFAFFGDIVFTETNIRFENCTVQGASLNGYHILTEDDILEGCSFDFINCDASFCTNGFLLERTGGTIQEVAYYLENCRALSERIVGGTNGFSFTGINEAVCRYCTAYNWVTGFDVDSSTDSLVLDNCIAELNTTGFLIDGVDTLCVECKAVGNTGIGFDINGDRTVIKNSCATGNGTGIDIAATADDVKIVETCSLNNTTNIVNNSLSATFVSIEIVQSIVENIDQTTNVIISELDECCGFLVSTLDNVDCLIGTPITSVPFIITTPGLYTLCEDLTQTGVTPAITIASDDVTLDLAQYTLTTTGVGSRGIEISAGMTNITIRNGNIVPNVEAIFVNRNEDVLIENISIYNAGNTAIRVESSIGVIIDSCEAIGSTNNSTGLTRPSAFWFGITDGGGDLRLGAVVTNCVVRGDDLNGLFPRGFTFHAPLSFEETNIRFENCTVHGATSDGYLIRNESDILELSSFTVINSEASNCFRGFVLENLGTTQDVTYYLENCRALRCRGPILGGDGFNFFGANNAICRYCTASGCVIGFNVSVANNTLLDNCIAEANTASGFLMPDTSTRTLCVECKAVANSRGFDIDSDFTVIKNSCATSNDIGIFIGALADDVKIIETCALNNGTTDIADNGPSTMIVSTEIIQSALVGTPLRSSTTLIPNAPFTITTPGLYTLATNITTTLTTGLAAITINSDDVVLDLGGHNINVAVSGVGTVHAIAVATGVDNFEIRNGTIAAGDSTNGISISSGTNCNGYIHDLLIRGTSGTVLQGIDIVSSTALTIEQCQFDLMNIGIRSTGSSAKFTIKDCVVTDALSNGMEFASSTGEGFEVSRCNVYSAAGTGGFVLNTATRAIFEDCKAVDCAGAGFVITAADTFAIVRNCLSLTNAGVGYSILGNGALLENCIATENGSTGFNASSTATVDVTLRGCISTGNASFGFFIASNMTTLENCLSTQNTADGFSSLRVGVSQVDFRGCTSTLNGVDGFDMGMAGNLLKDCLASHNVGRGLDDNGFAQVILDTRSALNGAADNVAASTVITY